MSTTRTATINDTERADPRHFCQFCGAAVEANRLICAPADASMCLDRQEREAAAMFPAYRIIARGTVYASTYPSVAAAERDLQALRCGGPCGCCRVEDVDDNGSSERSAA